MIKNLPGLLNKINPDIIEILTSIGFITTKCDIPFFVVGATARDVFFSSRRSTIDLDLGIQISSWDLFYQLIDALVKTDLFRKSDLTHRIYYIKHNYPLDIIPFGSIIDTDGLITWPNEIKMSILGFEEAFKNCYELQIETNIIRVVSPVGLAAMKIISWADSIDRAQKDAQDLDLIFSEYYSIFNNSERIFEYPDILKFANFDIVRSGIVLLGKDIAEILNKNTLKKIKSIVDRETDVNSDYRLAYGMLPLRMINEPIENKLQMLIDFKTGLCATRGRID